MNRIFLLIIFQIVLSIPCFAAEEIKGEAESKTGAVMRAMAIGTTYGVLAGAFLGLASIAFVQRPGKNLKNIAVGSSLGLYAGMFFGGYLAWSTFSEDRPSELPTEEDYDTMDYESYFKPELPKLGEGRLLSENYSLLNKEYDTWAIQIPVIKMQF